MVVTRHGRIVKTLGFGADLLHSSAAEQDPLALGLLNKETPLHWQHREVWAQQHQGGYTLNSTFVIKGHESVSIQGKAYDLMRVEEQVDVPAMNTQYINIWGLVCLLCSSLFLSLTPHEESYEILTFYIAGAAVWGSVCG